MATKINHIRWIWNEWKHRKLYIVLLLFMTLLSSAVAVGYPYVLKILIDDLDNVVVKHIETVEDAGNRPALVETVLIPSAPDSTLAHFIPASPDTLETPLPAPTNPMRDVYRVVSFLLIIGVVRILTAFYPGFRAYINLLMEYILRERYFSSMLQKDYRFFLKFRTGDLVTRLTADIQDFPKIGWFICSGIFRAFDSLTKILFCIVMMFLMSPKLTLWSLIPIPLMIVAFFFVSDILYRRFKKNQEAISEINNQLEMTFSGIKIIKSFVCEDKYKRFFTDALQNRYQTEFNLLKTGTLLHLTYEYIDFFSMITIILVGGYMTVAGDISIGTFYAFYTYFSILVFPMLDLPQLFVSGKQAFVCIERLEEIRDFPVESYAGSGKTKLTDIESIRFENVSFYYENDTVGDECNHPASVGDDDNRPATKRIILDGVSFEVRKGEKVLIIGSSGAGKTTILGLVSGRLIPQQGTIYINDIPISEIDMPSLRELVGYVPQEPSLFTGTIRDNVLFGKSEMETETYEKLLSVVQMSDEIAQFIDRDMTLLGQKGLSLSGGQKQRIAIARALYKNPQLLILDDITASLDAKKEDQLWAMVSPLFTNLTAFLVSHRLSSLRYADYVIYIDSGQIKAYGKHEELMKVNEKYREFMGAKV